MITTDSSAPCARCAAATVTVHGALPWCPQCEWNLGRFEPARRVPEFGVRVVDRWTHQVAYRLARRQFADLSQRTLDRPMLSAARLVTVTASLLLLAAVVLLAAFGVWLVLYDFPRVTILFGIIALALAFTLRPRLGRLDPTIDVLSRQTAPTLFAVVDQVAAATGAPAPHIIAVDQSVSAYTTSVGIRRRRVLCLGLPLWAVLPPPQRIALLGHELGHFVNGDVRRGLLTQPAFTMLGTTADLIRPVNTATTGVGEILAALVQAIAARVLYLLHLLLVWTGQRDAQRAEYLADELAATAAGSTAVADLMDTLLATDVIDMVIRREARAGRGLNDWHTAVAQARTTSTAQAPLLRQLSIRDEVSLFASHPPTGLRTRMLTARPHREPAVTLTTSQTERIDAELTNQYQRLQRNLGLE
ncbi:M48 family metallopeptidase [Phytohabitans rumicis]|uniref:M48 family metallopeptidase n=1 Tax=Phytohabitans rumicis TaxID=1076125 RepID=UPI001FEB4281|nr:M48 family metallopeptidase [Phytohabitans rumicis]